MVTITSAQAQKQFARYCELARREPVSITFRGREDLVLLSAAEFRRLKAFDTRQALYAHELPLDLATALNRAEPPEWTAQFDDELNG